MSTIGVPIAITEQFPPTILSDKESIFVTKYKTGHLMNEQIFKESTLEGAIKLAQEFCKEFGFKHITTYPFVADLRAVIKRHQEKAKEVKG